MKSSARLARSRLVLGCIAVGAVLTPIFTRPAPAAPAEGDGALALTKVGDEVFWEGVVIESAHVVAPELCGVEHECYEYKLRVPQAPLGSRLRVNFTAILSDPGAVRPWADFVAFSPEMNFMVELYAPGTAPGTHEPTLSKLNGNGIHGYSAELLVGGIDPAGTALPSPELGTWTIRVIPQSVTDMGFRMRATLDDATAFPDGLQYPDLRFNPPFEINFGTAPATFHAGVTEPHEGPHSSCMAEEVEEAVQYGYPPPQLCLRFSMGLENAGVGTFEILWDRSADEVDVVTQFGGATIKPHLQRVCDYLGQTCTTEPARGIETLFHWAHAHEHWVDAWTVELFKITDPAWTLRGPAPAMVAHGTGRKLGINPGNELIVDWDRFSLRANPRVGDSSGCFAEDGGNCSGVIPISLAAGFADLYEWNRGGNYVDFPQAAGAAPLTPQPGTYLLKGTMDPRDLVVESDERNNSSYALFEVEDDGAAHLIERGYGTSPWDRRKTVSTVSP